MTADEIEAKLIASWRKSGTLGVNDFILENDHILYADPVRGKIPLCQCGALTLHSIVKQFKLLPESEIASADLTPRDNPFSLSDEQLTDAAFRQLDPDAPPDIPPGVDPGTWESLKGEG